MTALDIPTWRAAVWAIAHWHAFVKALARNARARCERREFARLDAHALRDLGLARGEYDSYCAEAAGRVKATRRRLAAGPRTGR